MTSLEKHLLGAMLLFCVNAGAAGAYDERVKSACTEDYLAYCSQHAPESVEVRYCMEAYRNQLNKQCVKALVDAGEVPKKYLTKKVADRE